MNNNYEKSINTVSNNSKRLMYTITAVAALFIFILSGTYAYFTAAAEDTTTVQGSLGSFDISLSVTRIDNHATRGAEATNGDGLIPLQTTKASTWGGTTYQYGKTLNKALQNNCVDSLGYRICQVYEAALTIPSTMPLTYLDGSAQIVSNASNLKIASIKKKAVSQTTNTSSLAFASTSNTTYYAASIGLNNLSETPTVLSCENTNNLCFTNVTTDAVKDSDVTNDDSSVDGTLYTTYYYYFVVWFEDTDEPQTVDASKSFNGYIYFTSSGGTNEGQITAYFSS